MTLLQKGFSHREEAKTTKIIKKKLKNPKNFCGFLSLFFAIIKFPSRSSRLRGKKDVFAVDSSISFLVIAIFAIRPALAPYELNL